MQIPEEYKRFREDLELISERNRYKILLTLFASDKELSFSQLKELLPSIQENKLNYHLNILKENNLIENRKKANYKRSENRSFYSLSHKSLKLLNKLGLEGAKKEFHKLFDQMT
ncbi:MAG: ArsR family transcriptional regulator [Promethearchaeota archaeon]|nr:MAG: ArsR family transcriptional regulator [Candidatus Lokiarchaeota archaeon]